MPCCSLGDTWQQTRTPLASSERCLYLTQYILDIGVDSADGQDEDPDLCAGHLEVEAVLGDLAAQVLPLRPVPPQDGQLLILIQAFRDQEADGQAGILGQGIEIRT